VLLDSVSAVNLSLGCIVLNHLVGSGCVCVGGVVYQYYVIHVSEIIDNLMFSRQSC
jgi:hypothetical protein